MDISKFFFVLGGTDNEMEEIKSLLTLKGIPFVQPEINWGDIIVEENQLPESLTQDQIVIFVECKPGETFKGKYKIVDHHGVWRRKEASLLQVCKLLKIKPTLKQKIIASIDSDFLSRTIKKFPRNKKLVIETWESGYKKRFESEISWREFKEYCSKLWDIAKKENVIGPLTAVVWNAPPSMTMIGALADLEGWACLLICGNPSTHNEVPVFFQGNRRVVTELSKMDLSRSYFGKGYFGCRAIPANIVSIVKELLILDRI